MLETYNFKTQPYAYSPEELKAMVKGQFKDERTGIICNDPVISLEGYLNYIELLNGLRSDWVCTRFIDFGMMPLVMAPSFYHNLIKEELVKIAKVYDIPWFAVESISPLRVNYKSQDTDIWVYKSDVARVMGTTEDQVTLSRFIRWCKG